MILIAWTILIRRTMGLRMDRLQYASLSVDGGVEDSAGECDNDDDRHRDVVICKDVGDRSSGVDDNADRDIDDDMMSALATTLIGP